MGIKEKMCCGAEVDGRHMVAKVERHMEII